MPLALGEGDADRVDAVAIAGWGLRGIFENVAKVAAAGSTANLGSQHAMASVFDQFDGIAGLWLIETWPAAVRFKFCLAFEKFGTAASARKCAKSVFFEKLAGICPLGTSLAQHVILELSKFGLPLFFGLLYWIVHIVPFVA
ncbi:MAG: hypothetical protein RLZZ590_1028 [Actinomycetota bacterium]